MADPQPADGTQSVDVIATLLNLTPRRVQQLAKEGHIPTPVKGRYALVPTVQGYCRYMQNLAAGKGDTASAHTAAIQKERADKLARENAVARGELIPRGDVVTGIQTAIAHMRSRMLSIPTKAAPAVVIMEKVADVKEHLTGLVHDALEELSRTRFVAVPEGDGGPDNGAGADGKRTGRKAAAKPNRKRVGGRKPNAQRGKQRGTRKVGNRKG